MNRSACIAVGLCAVAVAAGSARAEPNPHRFAVVIGSNRAAGERAPLRYAHRDAQALASALVSVADFPPDQVKLLVDPKPEAVLEALDAQLSAIQRVGGETLLLFYYSGHADQAALYPGGQALPLPSVRARLDQEIATVRLGIIDACRGGGWTQAKGLTPEAPFEIQRPLSLESEGSVLIASSSGLESAHETEALEGSFFTHHLVAGLLGAADRSGDGEITAEEAFRYARELTVRDTALQAPQPQHPSFEMRLHGRNDLALARISSGPGTVTVKQSRGPLQILSASSGIALLELPPGPRSATVIVPAGRYLVVRRGPEGSSAAELTVDPARPVTLEESSLQPTEMARLAPKGWVESPPPGPNRVLLESAYLPPRVVGLAYERSLSEHWSVFVKPMLVVTFPDLRLDDLYEHIQMGFGAEIGGRWFPLGTGLEGLWVSAAATGLFAPDLARRTTGASAHVGYTLALRHGIDVSLAAGGSYLHARTPRYENGSGGLVIQDILVPDLRLATGFSF
jgi:Caspase domain